MPLPTSHTDRYASTDRDVQQSSSAALGAKKSSIDELYRSYLRQSGQAPGGGPPSGSEPARAGIRREREQQNELLPGQSSGKNKKKGVAKAKDPFAGDQTELSNLLRDTALAVMQGKEGRFNDKRVQDMKDQMFQSTIGRVKNDVRALDAGAVRRGIFRSGMSQRSEADLRRNALNAYSSGVKDIMIKKMDAEFQDKMAGLQATQAWLANKQNYELGKERNQIAREQIRASMAAAQLSAQVQREGIAASRGAAAANMRFNERQFAWQQAQDVYGRAAAAPSPYEL